MTDEIAALFDRWALDALAPYPTIGDGGPERVYARGAELRDLIESAYRAGSAAGAGQAAPSAGGMLGRIYADPGDRLSGSYDPPLTCRVLVRWGPGGGPRNVLARYDDGRLAVIPFTRRLRRIGAE